MEPAAKRLLRLTRSTAGQKALHADIFIQIRPVDPLATRDETPVGAFHSRPVCQTGEPGQWHGDGPTIRQVYNQRVIADTYTQGPCFPEFSSRNTHAISATSLSNRPISTRPKPRLFSRRTGSSVPVPRACSLSRAAGSLTRARLQESLDFPNLIRAEPEVRSADHALHLLGRAHADDGRRYGRMA
jgi:hypothetical protein